MEPLHDEILGTLEWDPGVECWRANRELRPGHRIDCYFWRNADRAFARRLFVKLQETDLDYKQAAAVEFLELHNDTWRDVEDPVLDAEAFMNRLRLDAAGVENNSEGRIVYDADWMFTEHNIAVFVGADLRVLYVTLE